MRMEREIVDHPSAIVHFFLDRTTEVNLRPSCEIVLQQEVFRNHLPERSLACIFDNQERPKFLDNSRLGLNFYGFTAYLRRPDFSSDVASWPRELLACVWEGTAYRFDVVIYLRSRTCQSHTSTIITFAHEIQHFIQYGKHRKLWLANRHLQSICTRRVPPWHFPHEYEAILKSKQVAEAVLTPKEVRVHAEHEREAEQTAESGDLKKWDFFLDLDAREDFRLLERTDSLVDECRANLLQKFPAKTLGDPDYSKEKWWE